MQSVVIDEPREIIAFKLGYPVNAFVAIEREHVQKLQIGAQVRVYEKGNIGCDAPHYPAIVTHNFGEIDYGRRKRTMAVIQIFVERISTSDPRSHLNAGGVP